jgi:hypothetical protein
MIVDFGKVSFVDLSMAFAMSDRVIYLRVELSEMLGILEQDSFAVPNHSQILVMRAKLD